MFFSTPHDTTKSHSGGSNAPPEAPAHNAPDVSGADSTEKGDGKEHAKDYDFDHDEVLYLTDRYSEEQLKGAADLFSEASTMLNASVFTLPNSQHVIGAFSLLKDVLKTGTVPVVLLRNLFIVPAAFFGLINIVLTSDGGPAVLAGSLLEVLRNGGPVDALVDVQAIQRAQADAEKSSYTPFRPRSDGSPSPAASLPSRPPLGALVDEYGALTLNGVRSKLADLSPAWYVGPPDDRYPNALTIKPFKVCVFTAPLDRVGLQASPLHTVVQLVAELKSVQKNTFTWPRHCIDFMTRLVHHFAFHAAQGLQQGFDLNMAIQVGETTLAELARDVAGRLTFLQYDVDPMARVEDSQAILGFVSALHRHFAPESHVSFSAWAEADLLPGETGFEYVRRVLSLATTFNMKPVEVSMRLKAAFHKAGTDRAASCASDLVQQLATTKTSGGNFPIDQISDSLIWRLPIIEKLDVKRAGPPGGPPLNLATAAKFGADEGVDIMRLFRGLDVLGINLGRGIKLTDIPRFAVTDNCPVCCNDILNVTIVGKWGSADLTDKSKQAYEHNTWRCRFAEQLVDAVCKMCPAAVKDDLFRKVSNPRAVAEAALRG